MSEKKVRFAVVGVQSIGNAYVTKAIMKIPEAELITICDTKAELLEKRRVEYGLDKAYTDFYEMIKDGGFDCVILGTPDQVHMEHSISSLH